MFKEWKRKQRIVNKIHKSVFLKCKDRFLIECQGRNSYSLYDTNTKMYADDWKWRGWDNHFTSWHRKLCATAKSCESAKRTADSEISKMAYSRMNKIIDSYHRVKNKPISYT